jgi:hypothetical protein
MLTTVVVTIAIGVAAGYVYLRREQLRFQGIGLAALRTVAMGALVLLLVNPGRSERRQGGNPVVLLDASLSMAAPGGHWESALDTAQVLAGEDGAIYRFGTGVAEFGSDTPTDGASRISAALRAAAALGGPVHVVTDGELDDAGIVDPRLLPDVSVVVIPRDTVPDVALLEVDLPGLISSGDSLNLTLTLGTWGDIVSSEASLEVFEDDRRIVSREIEIPPPPGIARRRVVLPPQLLSPGTNVLRVRILSAGDTIPGDDERVRIVQVSEQPAVVVLLDPPDWEGRFLVTELADVARTTVRGYARVSQSAWIEMSSSLPVPEESVHRFARNAGMRAVAVLTGVGTQDELEPLADTVIGSVADLADLLLPRSDA